jgi:hypothetical protein
MEENLKDYERKHQIKKSICEKGTISVKKTIKKNSKRLHEVLYLLI